MFDWDRFKSGEIAVHCDTEEKANYFLRECEREDIIWSGGDKATHHNNYSVHYEETCYFCRSKKITYCDREYFNKKRIEIIKWKVKEMKELTFKEVIANIKEGEVWESNCKRIIGLSCGAIKICNKYKGNFGTSVLISSSNIYKLQRKECTFDEAFKVYEEGKEIESKESGYKFKKIDEVDKYSAYKDNWIVNVDGFEIDEIRNKWYIND